MSVFNRKGFKVIKAKDPDTNKVFNAPVPVKGKLAGLAAQHEKKARRELTAKNREYKRQLRELKKAIPPEERSKINWAQAMLEMNEHEYKGKPSKLSNHDRTTLQEAKRKLAAKMAREQNETEQVKLQEIA